MTAQEFCYWLQGLMEVGEPRQLDERQTQQIKEHLTLVFEKKTPALGHAILFDPQRKLC